MPRTVKPGISFYRMDAGHILNKKVRLLTNEFGSEGYYIWSAILDKAYGKWGYFFDMNDADEFELFCSEYCKRPVQLVQEVIVGCLRRELFMEPVAQLFGILTSEMMQETFVVATCDRRDKGSTFAMQEEWLSDDLKTDVPKNIILVRGNISKCQWKNIILPPNNTQRRIEKNRLDERREDNNNTAPAGEGAAPPAPDLRELFKGVEKKKHPLYLFIRDHRPDFIEPYVELWNIFAGERGKAQVSKITDSRKKKFKTRIGEKAFDFLKVLEKAGKAGDFLSVSKWFTFDWIMESDSNYLKVMEGNYDKEQSKAADASTISIKDLDYLYGRFLEGAELKTLLNEKHCDFLRQAGIVEVNENHVFTAVQYRIKNLTGTNQAGELRALVAYQSGSWQNDPDCKADELNRTRIAKKLAAIELFNRCRTAGLKTLENAKESL